MSALKMLMAVLLVLLCLTAWYARGAYTGCKTGIKYTLIGMFGDIPPELDKLVDEKLGKTCTIILKDSFTRMVYDKKNN